MRLLGDFGLFALGTIGSLQFLHIRSTTEKYKHLGRLFAGSRSNIDQRTLSHLENLYGKKLITYAQKKPLRLHFLGQTLSTLQKAASIAMLILIQEICPKQSFDEMIPGHDAVTGFFFRATAPLGLGATFETITKYHIIDLMPLLAKSLNLAFEGYGVAAKATGSLYEGCRRLTEKVAQYVEAIWWARISLIVIGAGPGKEFMLSRTLIALVNRVLPIGYYVPGADLGNRDLRSGFARLYACAGSLSAVSAAAFIQPIRRELKTLDSLVVKAHSIDASWKEDDKLDQELQGLIDKIDNACIHQEITREDKHYLYTILSQKLEKDINDLAKENIQPKWKYGLPRYRIIRRCNTQLFKKLNQMSG